MDVKDFLYPVRAPVDIHCACKTKMVAELVIDTSAHARHDGYIAVKPAFFSRKGKNSTRADPVILYRDTTCLIIDKVIEQWLEYVVSFKIVLAMKAVGKGLGSYFQLVLVYIPGLSLYAYIIQLVTDLQVGRYAPLGRENAQHTRNLDRKVQVIGKGQVFFGNRAQNGHRACLDFQFQVVCPQDLSEPRLLSGGWKNKKTGV